MSLQAIFDPMVRAYFKKLYGGGSGGASGATIAFRTDKEYENNGGMVKLSDMTSIPEGTTPYVLHEIPLGKDALARVTAQFGYFNGIESCGYVDQENGILIAGYFITEECPPDANDEAKDMYEHLSPGFWAYQSDKDFYIVFEK